MRIRQVGCCLLIGFCLGLDPQVRASSDSTGLEGGGIFAGIRSSSGVRLVFNDVTFRLEVRNDLGSLLEEIPAGSVSRTVDAAGKEYRLSFGKDELGRPSVLVRPGPAMRKPLLVEVFGRKVVLSPNASLLATLTEDRQVFYEPSICGEVYYIEDWADTGNKVSRRDSTQREVAVLAKPSSLTGDGPGTLRSSPNDGNQTKTRGDVLK